MGYSNECTHGGPPIDLVEEALEVLEEFQNKVHQAELFNLPPSIKSYRKEQRESDLLKLYKLLHRPEYVKLKSADVARVFMSEAVDCNHRGEAIAQAWFCTAMIISAMAKGVAISEEEVPRAVKDQAEEADINIAATLWRWTPCDCVAAPTERFVWTSVKNSAGELVKEKRWKEALEAYESVLKDIAEAEESEKVARAASCFDCRGIRSIENMECERSRVLCNISLCRLSRRDAEGALEAATEAAKADPRFAKACARQVKALEALGRPALEAAENAVRRALAAGESAEEYKQMRVRHAAKAEEAAAETEESK